MHSRMYVHVYMRDRVLSPVREMPADLFRPIAIVIDLAHRAPDGRKLDFQFKWIFASASFVLRARDLSQRLGF